MVTLLCFLCSVFIGCVFGYIGWQREETRKLRGTMAAALDDKDLCYAALKDKLQWCRLERDGLAARVDAFTFEADLDSAQIEHPDYS